MERWPILTFISLTGICSQMIAQILICLGKMLISLPFLCRVSPVYLSTNHLWFNVCLKPEKPQSKYLFCHEACLGQSKGIDLTYFTRLFGMKSGKWVTFTVQDTNITQYLETLWTTQHSACFHHCDLGKACIIQTLMSTTPSYEVIMKTAWKHRNRAFPSFLSIHSHTQRAVRG